jgi:hypothetical protein
MGTILASAIIAKASGILQDASNIRWTAAKMLEYLNDGIRDTVIANPTAYVINGNLDLVAGTKQTLPAGTILLIDITRNMGAGGTTPGRVPRFIDRKEIDAEHPNWHTDTASATVKHWIYDNRDKGTYYVHPPQPASGQGKLEAVRSALPASISSSTAIPVGDEYANALADYLLHRAYAQDPVNMDLSVKYLESFLLRVTGKKSLDAEVEAAQDKEK